MDSKGASLLEGKFLLPFLRWKLVDGIENRPISRITVVFHGKVVVEANGDTAR